MSKLKVTTLFSGIGAQEAGLKRLGVDFEMVGMCEIDKYAIKSYEGINGPTHNYGDISKIDRLDYTDLLVYSSPCFPRGSMVLTDGGYKDIADIQVGDKVLTHLGNWKPVIRTMNNGMKKTVGITTFGSPTIFCTPNHLFYVRQMSRKYPTYYDMTGKRKRGCVRVFSKPTWVEAKSLTKSSYVGSKVITEEKDFVWNGVTYHWSDGRSDRYKCELGAFLHNEDFWWLVGRWVADGWCRYDNKNEPHVCILCCAKSESEEIEPVLTKLGFSFTKVEERTVFKFQIPSKELATFMAQFGRYAYGKFIPNEVLELKVNFLTAFLAGYMSGDGCETGGVFKAATVSKKLALGLAKIIEKCYKVPVRFYVSNYKPTYNIEGRTGNNRVSYGIVFKRETKKQDSAFYENGYVWYPVRKLSEHNIETVYDIEVEDDHSFTVENKIVHNCQDFSLAGRQAGLVGEDGKQTRSGLLLEVGRLLMKMSDEKILPKYLLMENVKNLVGKKFKPAFDIWLKALEAIGYNNYWKVLNAKDYGVPQNRERVFVVSIRKDVDTHGYTFPEPFKLNRRLKDVLETNVDEKYYLKQDLVDTFIKRLAKREVSNTIRCGGAGSIDQKHTWDLVVASTQKNAYKGSTDGSSPCLTAAMGMGGGQIPMIVNGGNKNFSQHTQDSVAEPSIVQNPHGYNNGGIIKDNVTQTMTSNGSYHLNNFVCNEPLIAASRGRNPDNPLSREAGLPTEQMLEINQSGCSNTLTTVGKDNLVVEPKITVLGNYKPSGHECGRVMGVDGVSPTIKDNHGAVYSIDEPQIKQLGNVFPTKKRDNPNTGRVYDTSGIGACLNTMGGGNREPCMVEHINACADVAAPALTAHLHKETVNDCTKLDRHSPALGVKEVGSEIRIRKLTPKECWRLMDFTDEEYEAAEKAGVSKTQLYKQAGNSIVVSCLAHIFRELLKGTEYEPEEGFKTDWLERLKGTNNV